MKELNLKEIQKAELSNLKVINRICQENNIKYFLAYGTLLGAIRHHGFIPWDDDTDVWMPRDEYEKFLKYCQKHTEEIKPFKLCTRENTPNYPYGVARFCDQRYKYVTINPSERDFELGVFTDIYPLDNLGNENIEPINELAKYCQKQNISYLRYCSGVSNNKLKAIFKKIDYLYLHLIHGKNYAKKVDANIIQKINMLTSPIDIYIGLIAWDSQLYKRYRKEDFKEIAKVTFEDAEFPVPKNYDNVLKLTYGNYMKFPPESERHPYHGYKIFKK